MPPELIDRILDFDRLVSDKAAYRSPARGAQGNALKTVLGIPFALGVHEPVIIEACGLRHEVTVGLDPGATSLSVTLSRPHATRRPELGSASRSRSRSRTAECGLGALRPSTRKP